MELQTTNGSGANLDLDLLRTFAVVAETRSFTRAAERLGRVQSAISMQVKRLEEITGTTLLERSRRGARLTPSGERLMHYALSMLRLNEEAMASFGRPSLEGRVRFGATDTSMPLLPPVLSAFAKRHPLIELELSCERSWDALDALAAGALDLALVTQDCGRSGGKVVRREPLFWAVATDSAADAETPLPLAIFGEGCRYRDAATAALDDAGLAWRHAYRSISRDGLDVAVRAGLAVTIVPESLLGNGLRPVAPERGLPALPALELLLFHGAGPMTLPVETLAEATVELLRR